MMTKKPSSYFVYILRCADQSYYTGMTGDLASRIAQHKHGIDPAAYTYRRRPVELLWSIEFSNHDDAFTAERQIKGWTRKKKEALIRGDFDLLHEIVRADTIRKDKQKRNNKLSEE
jgi:predicted GIY-YIG superfamily endonuclease